MFGWLARLADESHRSERVARRFHLGQAVVYGVLIAGYVCMISYHVSAAGRHRRAARLLDSARRANSGVAPNDEGC